MSQPKIPHSPDYERQIAAAVVFDRRNLARVVDVVQPEDLYDVRARLVLETALALDAAGTPVNRITMAAALAGKVREPAEYLGELLSAVPEREALPHYAERVRDLAMLRRSYDALSRLAAQALADPDPREFADLAQREIMATTAVRSRRQVQRLGQVAERALGALVERGKAGSALIGVPTGCRKLDRVTGGLRPGRLIVVGARPSMGKTALAWCWAMEAARVAVPSLFFSAEMSAEELAERAIGIEAEIESDHIQTGLRGDWISAAGRACAAFARWPVWIADDAAPTVEQIRQTARAWRAEHPGRAVVFVDYLQLVRTSGKSDSREREVAEISRGLKALAKEIEVPVVALAQLNRDLEKRPNKRPILSDLRESGSVEQDADLICFLYREAVYKKDADPRTAELLVAKHRNGRTGTCPMRFAAEYMRFIDEPEQAEQQGLRL